jgi:Na+/H+-dicarboxylate symporter
MKNTLKTIFKNYSNILYILIGIMVGSIVGLILKEKSIIIKPLGDIFLNLLFTAIIPLLFFTISSSIASLDKNEKLGKLFAMILIVFLGMIIISSIFMICGVMLFPINQQIISSSLPIETTKLITPGEQITQLLTVNDFFELLSRKNMLALIIFSFTIGFATLQTGEKAAAFKSFLISGNEVMKKVLSMIMQLAPIGLGAYFANQVGVFGPQLFGAYAKPLAIYYAVGLFYFIFIYSLFVYLSGGKNYLAVFWTNNFTPILTALGTCSSIATIPANLESATKIHIPTDIKNVVIPLGAVLHKDGSAMSSIIKIAVIFALFGQDFSSPATLILAIGITIIVSIVEGGIPNGGYIGEVLAITVYGFPMEQALPAAMIIGTLVDPLATLLNSNGDLVAAIIIARLKNGKQWIENKTSPEII